MVRWLVVVSQFSGRIIFMVSEVEVQAEDLVGECVRN